MPYVPLELPPGVYRNGTEFQSRGRWNDASLVRWENGEIKPVGGWQQKGPLDAFGTARGIMSWRGGSIGLWTATGFTGDGEGDNLLTFSSQFDNAAWTKTRSSITADATTAPDGTTTADKLVEDATASNTHLVLRGDKGADNTEQTVSVYAQAAGRDYLTVILSDHDAAANGVRGNFNLATGASSSLATGDGSLTSVSISDVGDGWYRCSVTGTPSATGAGGTARVEFRLSNSLGSTSYNGDGTSGVYLWGAQLVEASTAGTYPSRTKLYVTGADNTVVDITPTVIQAQSSDADDAGYGWLDYGEGTYGTARTSVTAAYNFAPTWTLDTWGEYLVACLDGDGRLYEWTLDVNTVAQPIANAPTGCSSLAVTQERFLMALGADGDSRKVAWCDQGDNTTWTPASTNQAGSFYLETEGPIMQGLTTRGQTLIFTTTDVFAATYIGAPLVYSFERVGSSNGIVSRHAAVASDSFVAWMGPRGFWVYDGFVRQIPCEVEDHVFSDFNADQQSKVHGWVNSQYNEVWWHYPSADSSECDRYVTWNYAENHWSIGVMDSLAACDRGVLRYPLMVHSDGKLYEHEVTGVATGTTTPYLTSGPISLPGYDTGYVTKLIPDEKTQGDVYLTLLSKRFPNGAEQTHGPYLMRDPVSIRCNARQVRMKVTQASTGDWRFGVPNVQVRKGGER